MRLEALVPPALVERGPYLIALTDSSAVVRWKTRRPMPSAIRYWVDADTSALRADGRRRSHVFVLEALRPGSAYGYQILLGNSAWSPAFAFTTFPPEGERSTFTFLVVGDTGTGSYRQLRLAEILNREEAAFLLHVGDLAYPAGSPRNYDEHFFAVYQPLLTRIPVFPVPGNHDFLWDGGRAYAEAFSPPGGHTSGSPFHYGFRVANALFIALQSEGDRGAGVLVDGTSRQRRWLERELRLASRDDRIDWIIVYLHRPLYSASTGVFGYGSDLDLRKELQPSFEDYGVRLVFSGHDHDYQRSKPILGGRVVGPRDGVVYFVTGGGGGFMGFRGIEPEWFTARAEEAFHFLRVHLEGDSIKIEAVDDGGIVFDRYSIEHTSSRAVRVPLPDGNDTDDFRSPRGRPGRYHRRAIPKPTKKSAAPSESPAPARASSWRRG